MAVSKDVECTIWEKAVCYSCSPDVCPCRCFHTVLIQSWKIHSMAASHVILDIALATDGPLVEHRYNGVPLTPSRCAHDLDRHMQAKVSMPQWTHVIRKVTSFIMIAAKLHGSNLLDSSTDFAGILPNPLERTTRDASTLGCVEYFCGAFSGWSQVFDALPSHEVPCHVKLALDLSSACARAYQQSFDLPNHVVRGPWFFGQDEDELPTTLCIESDIRSYKWLHLLGTDTIHLNVASPPCPPWSKANHGPGLAVPDGALLLDVLGVFKLTQPKVIAIEMVAGMSDHSHYRHIRDFLRFAGFHIRWSTTLNLRDVLPQNRERFLVIAVRCTDHDVPGPFLPCHCLMLTFSWMLPDFPNHG